MFGPYIQPAIDASKKPATRSGHKILAAACTSRSTLHEAPVHLFVAGWTRRGQVQPQGLYPAVQNVTLVPRAVRLGASLTNIHLNRDEGGPFNSAAENRPTIAVMLPIGWPKVPYRRPVRKSIDECFTSTATRARKRAALTDEVDGYPMRARSRHRIR